MLTFVKNKWLDLGITAKVGLILITFVLACLVVAGASFIRNSQTAERLQAVVTTLLPANRLSQQALTTFTEELKLFEDALVTDEEVLLKKGQEKKKEVDTLLAELGLITANLATGAVSSVPGLRREMNRYADQAVRVYGRMIQADGETESEQFYAQAVRLGRQALALHDRLDRLNSALQGVLDTHLNDVRRFNARQQRLGILLTLLSIGIALLISFLLTRLITRPIVALAAVTRNIARGSWSGRLEPAGNDEVAGLTRSFNEMFTVLRQREEALVQSEKKYREIFDATREAIIIYDAATMQMLDANRTCRELTGYSAEEIVDMQFGDMGAGIPPYVTELAQSYFKKTLAGDPQTFEWPVRTKYGEVAWAELSLTLSELGRKKVLIMVARNISERKKNEEEKQELAKQLQQADKMETLGTLAGGIAHDFNNILSGILGYTELAAMRPTAGEDIKADLVNVRKAAFRARDLVSQILAFSRKSDKVSTTVFEPAIIVKEVLKLLRSSTPATIEIEQHINTRAKIEADPSQFHQIMMNEPVELLSL
jgi:PAS domain S-box-containing protein